MTSAPAQGPFATLFSGESRAARVAPAPNFHGRSAHGATFEKLANQLLFTFRLDKSPRADQPRGYIAYTQNWGKEVCRVDFDLAEDARGDLILIVTGWGDRRVTTMTKKRPIVDPDLGPVEVPEPPKRADAERLLREQREAFEKVRIWHAGSVSKCPRCERRSFVGRDDLSTEIARPGGVVIYRHLRGAKCSNCGAQSLEPSEQIQIEREAGIGQVADYEAKVSNIGSGTVGTYWPKDVVRVMNLDPDTRAYIQVIDRETALIRFVRGKSGGRGSKGRRKKE